MSASIVLASLALLLACVSIALRFWETPPELTRRMDILEIELQESVETMSKWMKRENVRRAREVKDEKAAEVSAPPPGLDAGNRKVHLRAVARSKGLRI